MPDRSPIELARDVVEYSAEESLLVADEERQLACALLRAAEAMEKAANELRTRQDGSTYTLPDTGTVQRELREALAALRGNGA